MSSVADGVCVGGGKVVTGRSYPRQPHYNPPATPRFFFIHIQKREKKSTFDTHGATNSRKINRQHTHRHHGVTGEQEQGRPRPSAHELEPQCTQGCRKRRERSRPRVLGGRRSSMWNGIFCRADSVQWLIVRAQMLTEKHEADWYKMRSITQQNNLDGALSRYLCSWRERERARR